MVNDTTSATGLEEYQEAASAKTRRSGTGWPQQDLLASRCSGTARRAKRTRVLPRMDSGTLSSARYCAGREGEPEFVLNQLNEF
jgi:hypothetical protein